MLAFRIRNSYGSKSHASARSAKEEELNQERQVKEEGQARTECDIYLIPGVPIDLCYFFVIYVYEMQRSYNSVRSVCICSSLTHCKSFQ